MFFREFMELFNEMAPWLLLGFLIAGLLHVYMPKESIPRYMGKSNLRSAINASLLGIPLPLCSCGVIPTAVSFFREGASKGSTVSFLISTPQTGIDSILATYSLLGLPFAIVRPMVAFFSGIFGGTVTNLFLKNMKDSVPKKVTETKKIKPGGKVRTMLRYAFYEFLMDIANWLLIGLAIAALIAMLLPDDFFNLYLGNELLGMLIILAASIPLYVCATGSIPIAAVLMMKGLSPGAALVFLMAGPATNTATMTVIAKTMGKRTAILYTATIIVSSIAAGLFINTFLPREWFTGFISHGSHHQALLPEWFTIASGIALSLLLITGYLRKYSLFPFSSKHGYKLSDLKITRIKVAGMTCNHCKMTVEKALGKIMNVESVNANPATSVVEITGGPLNHEEIRNTLDEAGYEYKGLI
ncbi:MAG: permease [Bacteroidales bacterium]|nr:permease [Bacteroidales bacterium]